MIIFYDDGASPNGEKVRIVLAELGLKYETRSVDLKTGGSRTPEFTALNPNQKFFPEEAKARAEILKLMFFEANFLAATLGGPGGIADQLRRDAAKRNVMHLEEAKRELARQVTVIERVLADGRSYMAYEYSIADMQLFPALRRAEQYGLIAPSPLLRAWLDRVLSREAVQQALAASGAFAG